MAQPEKWTLRQKIIGVLLRQARLEVGKTLKECGQVLGFSSGVVSASDLFARTGVARLLLERPSGLLFERRECPFRTITGGAA